LFKIKKPYTTKVSKKYPVEHLLNSIYVPFQGCKDIILTYNTTHPRKGTKPYGHRAGALVARKADAGCTLME
jgi:hypothetical protein